MLIGIDASRANRSHKSGTEWYSYYLIKALAQADSKNQYVLYTDQPLNNGLQDLTADGFTFAHPRYDHDGYQLITSPHHNFKAKVLKWPLRFFWTLGRLSWEMLMAKPDILFVPAHGLPLIRPAKSVATIHDIGFKTQAKNYANDQLGPRNKSFRQLIRLFTLGKYRANTRDYLHWSTEYALRHAQKILTISRFTKDEILRYYQVAAEKIVVVPNGYNSRLYQKVTNQKTIEKVLDKYGIKQPFIFYVGRLEKKKNIDRLIEAFALMRNHNPQIKHKLYLVGDASYGFDEIKYLINEFAVEYEIVPTGWIEEGDLPAIFSGCDAFVFPSNYEGFGIPLLQAFACGAPVVASDAAAIPEVGGEAVLYFDPNDVNDMADKMAKLLNDPNLRADLIAKGQERVKNFSWRQAAQQIIELFNSL